MRLENWEKSVHKNLDQKNIESEKKIMKFRVISTSNT